MRSLCHHIVVKLFNGSHWMKIGTIARAADGQRCALWGDAAGLQMGDGIPFARRIGRLDGDALPNEVIGLRWVGSVSIKLLVQGAVA